MGARRGGRRRAGMAEEPRAGAGEARPRTGRNTKGGRVTTSKPLRFVLTRAGVATWLGVGSGDDDGLGDGDSSGVGEGDGVGVGAWRAKLAHGFGRTLAHSLCTPGLSVAIGLTRVLKLPFASAVAAPATLAAVSQ